MPRKLTRRMGSIKVSIRILRPTLRLQTRANPSIDQRLSILLISRSNPKISLPISLGLQDSVNIADRNSPTSQISLVNISWMLRQLLQRVIRRPTVQVAVCCLRRSRRVEDGVKRECILGQVISVWGAVCRCSFV